MHAATLWILLAFLPPDHGRPPVMVIERFPTAAQCQSRLAILRANRVTFDCLPSRQIGASRPVTPDDIRG